MRLRVFVCLVVLFGFVSMGAAGCGKKGPPKPPDEASYRK
jgi:predicted small lipoprotein YifL